MRMWVTTIRAIDPKDGQLKTWGGQYVPGITKEDAERYCQENELGYCEVDGELIAVIPTKSDGVTPNSSKSMDYSLLQQN